MFCLTSSTMGAVFTEGSPFQKHFLSQTDKWTLTRKTVAECSPMMEAKSKDVIFPFKDSSVHYSLIIRELGTLIQYHLQWLHSFTQVAKSSGLFEILSTALLVVSNLCIRLMLFGFREIYMMFDVIERNKCFYASTGCFSELSWLECVLN